MSPEFGSTCAFFPVDDETLRYLRATGREEDRIALVEAYAKEQGLWHDPGATARYSEQGLWREDGAEPVFTDTLELDLSTVVPSVAGPKRPQDRIALTNTVEQFRKDVEVIKGGPIAKTRRPDDKAEARFVQEGANGVEDLVHYDVDGEDYGIHDGSIVIAAITSCTNTSNPSILMAAGLLARNAKKKGLAVKPWVKTSLAPGSQVVTDYLEKSGLQDDLDALGFNLVGYGCTTCIGNSGPLPEPISKSINDNNLVACSVLSGNRNFEGRISPDVRANYLASPPLVVAYALAGSMHIDLTTDPLGKDADGNDVYLKDIWPTSQEIAELVRENVNAKMFAERYGEVFTGDERWRAIEVSGGDTYEWPSSTYVQNPPYFEGMDRRPKDPEPIEGARVIALLGESVTTDHISPAGAIKEDSPAGSYLQNHQVPELLWLAPRQPRGHDAGDLCQYPHQEPDAGRCRRWVHEVRAYRRADADLRRCDEVQAGWYPARGLRR